MRIGLFGGPFNPPHAAHLAASLLAMKRLKLDRVWWLVTPGNPLKDTARPAAARASASPPRATLASDPRIDITGLEAVIGTRYTYDTIAYPASAAARRAISSGSWAPTICGASTAGKTGAASRNSCPMAVVDRIGSSLYAAGGRAAQALARYRLPERVAASARRSEPAGLGLSPRPQVAAVVDRAACADGQERRDG